MKMKKSKQFMPRLSQTLVIALVAVLMLVVGPISASALPESCQDIHDGDPTATDGVYTIYPNGNTQVFDVYCNDMAGTPSEYLELQNTGGLYNFGQYTTEIWPSLGTTVKTSYQKIRLDPATLMVDIGDQTFATSSGSRKHGSTTVTSMPYGVAMDCEAWYSQTGVANIDLSGTPFAVADTFSVGGYKAAGTATFSQDNQIVNLNGGGYCGWITPSPWLYNPINAQGGFRLDLEYIGPQFVFIDIKPGSDPNSINTKNKGVIPVAILTNDNFDALDVNWTTVRFGPNEASPVHDLFDPMTYTNHTMDIDGDGDRDMVLHFRTQETGISPGDTGAVLTGKTVNGDPIIGSDSIRTVK